MSTTGWTPWVPRKVGEAMIRHGIAATPASDGSVYAVAPWVWEFSEVVFGTAADVDELLQRIVQREGALLAIEGIVAQVGHVGDKAELAIESYLRQLGVYQ